MGENSQSACSVTKKESAVIRERIFAELRESGLRRTKALEKLLEAMTESHKPFLLAELCELPGLAGRDQATIYRLVTKLKDLGFVRQLNFGDKGNYFELVIANHHHDYMFCQGCGEISEAPFDCVLEEVEQTLQRKHGWKNLSHSLSFHGTCPKCSNSSPGDS